MLVVPYLAGAIWQLRWHELSPVLVALFLAWIVAYFAFFAASQWLKARRKERYQQALLTYSVAAAVLIVVVLLLKPAWWSWGLVFAPLTAVSLYLAATKRERSTVSGLLTVLAASLLPIVLGSDGLWRLGDLPDVAAISAACFGYFFGTVLYVKTNIRERGRRSWLIASVLWHAAWTVIAFFLPVVGGIWLSLLFAVLTIRALVVPQLGPRWGIKVRPVHLGVSEIVVSVVLLLLLSLA